MVRIQVIYKNDGVSGQYVHISWNSGGHSNGRTDSNGYIDFDVSGGYGKIYVEGTLVHDGKIEGIVKVPRIY